MDVNECPDPDFKFRNLSDEEIDEGTIDGVTLIEHMNLSIGDIIADEEGKEPREVIHIFPYGEIRMSDFYFGYEHDVNISELYTWWRRGEIIPMRISLTPK